MRCLQNLKGCYSCNCCPTPNRNRMSQRPNCCGWADALSDRSTLITVGYPLLAWPAAKGREHPVATGSFQGTKFHRRLSGDEFEEMAVASRPVAASQLSTNLPVSQTQVPRVECSTADVADLTLTAMSGLSPFPPCGRSKVGSALQPAVQPTRATRPLQTLSPSCLNGCSSGRSCPLLPIALRRGCIYLY